MYWGGGKVGRKDNTWNDEVKRELVREMKSHYRVWILSKARGKLLAGKLHDQF